MKFDPQKHHRHSIRLPGYDYSQAGAYFVTMVTQGRACLFGEVVDGEMRVNPPGEMVERWWYELINKFPTVAMGKFVVMPNHFHGVIIINSDPVDGAQNQGAHAGAPQRNGAPLRNDARGIVGVDLRVDPVARVDHDLCADHDSRADPNARAETQGAHTGAPLPTIIQWFKTMTTNEYIRGVKQLGWEPFAGKLWQRNYYEHIIRNDAEHERIDRYITSNPANWQADDENPGKSP